MRMKIEKSKSYISRIDRPINAHADRYTAAHLPLSLSIHIETAGPYSALSVPEKAHARIR